MRAVVKDIKPREGYDRWATGYDTYDNPLIALEEPVVAELLGSVRGLHIEHISEHIVDEDLLKRSRSAEKWFGLPFLLVLKLTK